MKYLIKTMQASIIWMRVIGLSFFCFAQPGWAQDTFPDEATVAKLTTEGWGVPYKPNQNAAPGPLVNQAERFQKSGALAEAVANAIHALYVTEKKGQTRRAQEILEESFEQAITKSEREIAELQSKIPSSSVEKVDLLNQTLKIYNTLFAFMDELVQIPDSRFEKRKGGTVDLTPKDYRKQIASTTLALNYARYEAAEDLYQKAIMLRDQGGVDNNRNAAKLFRYAIVRYVPIYKDCNEQYRVCRENGTTRIAVVAFENKHGNPKLGDLGLQVSNELISAIKKNQYEFLELVNRDQLDVILANQKLNISDLIQEGTGGQAGGLKGIHAVVVGNISSVSDTKQQPDPTTQEMKKSVVVGKEKVKNAEGKDEEREIKETVKATFMSYSKSMTVIVKGGYQVLAVGTGMVLKTGNLTGTETFSHSWGRYSGDRRALDRNQLSLAEAKELEYPSVSSLVPAATTSLAKQTFSSLSEYLNAVGK